VPVGELGRVLVAVGLLVAVVGLVLILAGRIPWLGRLPGDIAVQRGNWSFYFPLTTSIVISLLLSLLLYVIGRR
jgi:membrane protein implicated in regulation of membrane protease activity